MPRFCANLTMLFPELGFMDRFGAAKDAGFDAVEVLSPYDVPVQDVVNQLARFELQMVLINCPPPNYTGGVPGFAAVAGSEARFRQDFKRTIRYARAMKTQCVHVMAGEAEGPGARSLFIDNLRWAAAEAPKQMLTIEPLNPTDRPGYFLNDYHVACDILRDVDAPNLRLQFDTYHVARIHGDVMPVWDAARDLVGHIQVGQTPHRTEPDKGEIDHPAFFQVLDRDGYTGWVSAEYHPAGTTLGGLGWMGQANA